MTRDDIIRMAREAGWSFMEAGTDTQRLERFAALVAAAEREACRALALAADDQGSVNQRLMKKRIASAIRKWGQP